MTADLIPSPVDDRDYPYIPLTVPLPPAIDMRRYGGLVEQQGRVQSCTANAVVSACEIILQRGDRFTDLSRLFLYYKTRELAGEVGDVGATLRNTLRAASHFGLPPESIWPYIELNEAAPPGDFCYPIAATRKIGRYERINLLGEEPFTVCRALRSALAEGCPVVVAMRIGARFFDVTGPLEQQSYGNVGSVNPLVCAHAMALVGYTPSYFIAENSLGPEWGDAGHFCYTSNLLLDTFELWVIKNFAGLDSERRKIFLKNQPVCKTFVQANGLNPQRIIDTARDFELTAADLEWLMAGELGWYPGFLQDYSQAQGIDLDWEGFL